MANLSLETLRQTDINLQTQITNAVNRITNCEGAISTLQSRCSTIETNLNTKLPLAGGTLSGAITTRAINMTTGYALKHGANTIIDTAGKVWLAVYNDIAEWTKRANVKEKLEPGDVLSWTGTGVTLANVSNAKQIYGVYSDTYGLCLGGDDGSNYGDNIKKYVPVGLIGQVNVKVTGDVSIGDLLTVSGIDGVAESVGDNNEPGTVIGKALNGHVGNGVDQILMLILNA